MKTCATCAHWCPRSSGARSELLAMGECHAKPPARDFSWPRTKSTDYCSEHATQRPAAETPAPARKPRFAPRTELPLT